ncbi:MAG: type II toxin-antitoxin system VapC family toxin [Prevotellaceae bacterium]|jgi:predicted nucleic acid-binding protein|nr:type II toxin-antitoxin system VapC family toxin [Prevotellaceae bacterium]
MNGNRIVCDTNVLIHLLGKNDVVRNFLRGKEISLSVITELELYAKQNLTEREEKIIDTMIDCCFVIELTQPIKQIVKEIRKTHKIKLPDAIIAASAIYYDIPFITFDSDFKNIDELELVLMKN